MGEKTFQVADKTHVYSSKLLDRKEDKLTLTEIIPGKDTTQNQIMSVIVARDASMAIFNDIHDQTASMRKQNDLVEDMSKEKLAPTHMFREVLKDGIL